MYRIKIRPDISFGRVSLSNPCCLRPEGEGNLADCPVGFELFYKHDSVADKKTKGGNIEADWIPMTNILGKKGLLEWIEIRPIKDPEKWKTTSATPKPSHSKKR